MDLAALVAKPVAGLVPVDDARAPLRVLIASLAPGGAERIVLEWLAAEHARGRDIELAVLHARRHALALPQGIRTRSRGAMDPGAFVGMLAREWRGHPAPVSTHLVGDDLLAILWDAGVRTVPTVHNAPEGWRNDASAWRPCHVPLAIACAESVRRELAKEGCDAPLVTLRHRPRVGAAAFDPRAREQVRASVGIAPGTFVIVAIGAIKPQKDYARAIEVVAALARLRDAALVILGGAHDGAGLAEVDRMMGRAVALGVAPRLRLPGFVAPVEPWLAASDALLNVSRFEGLSIAVQEALAAGLPVVATNVGGQDEIAHPALTLVPRAASADSIAACMARWPVRTTLEPQPFARAPRAWSVATFPRAKSRTRIYTLFVTANLNAGGAQRSLANLAGAIARDHRLAVAVCGESTQPAFAARLRAAGIETFRAAPTPDPFALAESILAHAQMRGASSLCFWNVDARVKLLAAKFAPRGLRIVDVSPGDYAFDEMRASESFAGTVATSMDQYHARLDTLVLKYQPRRPPPCERIVVIPNGVDFLAPSPPPPDQPRFVVSGRIAPSKRIERVIAAFAQVRAEAADAQLHIFGTVEERHRGYAEDLAVSGPGIVLRGPSFEHAHFREPWSAAVVLGTHQGSPNAVLEAMAAGVAVIANDSGGTRECVTHGETGWLLAEDPATATLAGAMIEAARDRDRAARLGARGRAFVRAHRTMDRMARRYLGILAPESCTAHEKITAWMPLPESPPISGLPASNR